MCIFKSMEGILDIYCQSKDMACFLNFKRQTGISELNEMPIYFWSKGRYQIFVQIFAQE